MVNFWFSVHFLASLYGIILEWGKFLYLFSSVDGITTKRWTHNRTAVGLIPSWVALKWFVLGWVIW